MEEIFGTLSPLGICFQEAVLAACDEYEVDPSNLTESDWNSLYSRLSEENFGDLVTTALNVASGNRDIRVGYPDRKGQFPLP